MSSGGDGSGINADLHVDADEAASRTRERGFALNPEDIPPTTLAYFD